VRCGFRDAQSPWAGKGAHEVHTAAHTHCRIVGQYLGHENAAVLDGGLAAWTQQGQPTTTEATGWPAVTDTGSPHPELLATWEYVMDRLGNPDVQILDVRPPRAYTGEAAGTDLPAGHIPGALNLDWNDLVQTGVARRLCGCGQLLNVAIQRSHFSATWPSLLPSQDNSGKRTSSRGFRSSGDSWTLSRGIRSKRLCTWPSGSASACRSARLALGRRRLRQPDRYRSNAGQPS
jgi:rhodanese-related sulfurtransferase